MTTTAAAVERRRLELAMRYFYENRACGHGRQDIGQHCTLASFWEKTNTLEHITWCLETFGNKANTAYVPELTTLVMADAALEILTALLGAAGPNSLARTVYLIGRDAKRHRSLDVTQWPSALKAFIEKLADYAAYVRPERTQDFVDIGDPPMTSFEKGETVVLRQHLTDLAFNVATLFECAYTSSKRYSPASQLSQVMYAAFNVAQRVGPGRTTQNAATIMNGRKPVVENTDVWRVALHKHIPHTLIFRRVYEYVAAEEAKETNTVERQAIERTLYSTGLPSLEAVGEACDLRSRIDAEEHTRRLTQAEIEGREEAKRLALTGGQPAPAPAPAPKAKALAKPTKGLRQAIATKPLSLESRKLLSRPQVVAGKARKPAAQRTGGGARGPSPAPVFNPKLRELQSKATKALIKNRSAKR